MSTMYPSFSLKIKHLKLAYHYLISNSIYLFLIILSTILAKQDLTHLHNLPMMKLKPNLIPIVTLFTLPLLLLLTAYYLMNLPRKVYLVDFACFKPHPSLKTSKTTFMDRTASHGAFSDENIEFQRKISEQSGIGDETYLPNAIVSVPPRLTTAEAWYEAEMLMFGAIDEVFGKTGVNPKDIGLLVVNCSLFTPIPSLASMVVNRYKLRENIRSYNLSGMGCSAGLISIDLAQRLLQVHPNSYALVVTTEITTTNWYHGNDRSMLISNSLFKMGAAAILLSNKHYDRYRSKYNLGHVIRTHKGAQDNNYYSIYQREDESQFQGLSLSKDMMNVAGEALKTNITTLGPLVLPMSEQLLFLATLGVKKVFRLKTLRPYIPDFKLAFEHFCIHAGGKAVLYAVEKHLELSEWHIEPSKMTLYRFGNTSSSSLWYELAYIEAKGRINKGDRIWQIGFGAGFKCNSVVWHALRTINPTEEKNPWTEEFDKFPIQVPKVSNIAISTMRRCL